MAKVTELMATKIDINTVEASKSVKGLQSAIRATTAVWRAHEAQMKSAGDALGAAKEKYNGLTKNIELLQERLKYLRDEQRKIDQSTEKGAVAYNKYAKQIANSERQLNSLVGQQIRTKEQLKYQESGLAKLQKNYNSISALSKSYIVKLETEGKKFEANKAKISSYRVSIDNLTKQLKLQEAELKKISSSSSATSEAYIKQKIRINETATAIAKYRKELTEAERIQNKFYPTSIWNKVVKGATEAENRIHKMNSVVSEGLSKTKASASAIAGGIAVIANQAFKGAKKVQNLQQSYKEITNLAVLGGEKEKEVTKAVAEMQRQGREMSIKYGKSQESIAEAYEDLVKRGYTTKQALGAMQTELQASVASGDDFKDVVTVSSQVLEGFGMRAKSTAGMTKNTKDVVNQLAYAADMTSTGFQDLGVGMSYVSSVAHQADISLAGTASAMGILSNNGLELLAS